MCLRLRRFSDGRLGPWLGLGRWGWQSGNLEVKSLLVAELGADNLPYIAEAVAPAIGRVEDAAVKSQGGHKREAGDQVNADSDM
jgi:hypothetical protein